MFAHTCGIVNLFDSSDSFDHHGAADGWGGFRGNTGGGYAHGRGAPPGRHPRERPYGESQEHGPNNGAGSAYGQGREGVYNRRNIEVV